MRKTAFKTALGVLLVAVLMVAFAPPAEATQYTKSTPVKVQVNQIGVYQFTHTFVAATDTINFVLPTLQPGSFIGADTCLYYVNVYTQSVNGDSTAIDVRYLVSSDGSNWKSYTILTDSTSWASAATASTTGTGTYGLNTFVVSSSSHGGIQPYNRIRICGEASNLIGTKIKVDVIPVKQSF